MEFFCEGSLGDSYVNICKLYGVENADVTHFTKHKFWYPAISQIYSLIDVDVKFGDVSKRKVNISSMFKTIEHNKGVRLETFPIFSKLKEPYKKFNLQKDYIVVCPKTGRTDQPERRISDGKILDIINKNPNKQIVLLGKENVFNNKLCTNLIGKTNLIEALSITAHSSEVHTYHGLFGFFSLSQKIPTTIYEKSDKLINSCNKRILPEWKEYLMGYVK